MDQDAVSHRQDEEIDRQTDNGGGEEDGTEFAPKGCLFWCSAAPLNESRIVGVNEIEWQGAKHITRGGRRRERICADRWTMRLTNLTGG